MTQRVQEEWPLHSNADTGLLVNGCLRHNNTYLSSSFSQVLVGLLPPTECIDLSVPSSDINSVLSPELISVLCCSTACSSAADRGRSLQWRRRPLQPRLMQHPLRSNLCKSNTHQCFDMCSCTTSHISPIPPLHICVRSLIQAIKLFGQITN